LPEFFLDILDRAFEAIKAIVVGLAGGFGVEGHN